MKSNLFLVAAGLLVVSPLWARLGDPADQGSDSQDLRMGPGVVAGTNAPPSLPPDPTVSRGNGGQPIYISNQVTPSANAQVQSAQIQRQPVTQIEASPLTESRADQIRKQRQEMEVGTETKIVEKLEQSRMEDERRRADALFGDRFNNMNTPPPPPPAPVYAAPAPVIVTQPAPVVEVAPVVVTHQPRVESPSQTYFMGSAGLGEYPDIKNVRGNYSVGVGLGQRLQQRLLVEGTFSYSNYQIEKVYSAYVGPYPEITDMDQYALGGAVKYQFGRATIRPNVGIAAAYSYRQFTDTQYYNFAGKASSHAIDAGLLAGADLELTDDFALGLEMKYLWNVYNHTNGEFQRSFVRPALQLGTPIEELSYYTLSLVGRVTF